MLSSLSIIYSVPSSLGMCFLDTAALWSKPGFARWRWQNAAGQGSRARRRGTSGGHPDSPITRYETGVHSVGISCAQTKADSHRL